MSSQIDATKPTAGSATTSSVRTNFDAAEKEIKDLQKISTMFNRTAGSGSAYTVSLTDKFETDALVDGARVTVEIHTISTSTTPTLTVTAGGTALGAKTIVKAGAADGSALVAGDLKEDALIELMYVASGGDGITDKFVWLNCASESANLTSPTIAAGALSGDFSGNPNFTGSPTSTTAAVGTNTTQIATTAFVQAAKVITNASQLRLQADLTGKTGSYVLGDSSHGSFSVATDTGYSGIGSVVTVSDSTGAFEFPATGIYLVIFTLSIEIRGADSLEGRIIGTDDNFSTDNSMSCVRLGNSSANDEVATGSCFTLFDCVATGTHKIKLQMFDVDNSNTRIFGDSGRSETAVTFVRIGDT